VESLDRRLRFGVRVHFDEPEPLASARLTILDNLGASDGPILAEPFRQIRVRHRVCQISNMQFLSHF
jgi:hypothetical protein